MSVGKGSENTQPRKPWALYLQLAIRTLTCKVRNFVNMIIIESLSRRRVSFFTIESPQSRKHSSLLLIKWICTFICFWQAMCCLPDSAVEWLLKFLKAVFELIGKQSTFMSALAAALPSSSPLWRFLKID